MVTCWAHGCLIKDIQLSDIIQVILCNSVKFNIHGKYNTYSSFRAQQRLQKAREQINMSAAQKNARVQELHKKIRVCILTFIYS